MDERDKAIEQRIRDIIAVTTSDIDAVTVDVEDGVAYVEGAVPNEAERRALVNTIRQVRGVRGLVACLSAEHVRPVQTAESDDAPKPPPALLGYYSLS